MPDSLSGAIIALNADLDLPAVLNRFLEVSLAHTGAKHAAINVLGPDGQSVDFYFKGMDRSMWDAIGRGPRAVGVLGRIPAYGTLVVDEVTAHPAFEGFPEGHPTLGSFLGTALRVRDRVFGYLYLASKDGGFTAQDETIVRALAAAASVAIDNSTLYQEALERERWLTASQEVTTRLLADPGDEGALAQLVEAAKELGQAAAATLVLPGMDENWVLEFTVGAKADEMLGLILPEGGYALKTIRSGVGTYALEPPGEVILEPIRDFGPALYAPLRAEGRTVGLLMLYREKGQPGFGASDLDMAQRFADQAALALSVAELRHVKDVSALLENRQRIADDLHDLVSQELFAAAIQLESLAEQVPEEFRQTLENLRHNVIRAQKEVRGVVSTLDRERSSEPLSERVRREIVLSQNVLGFAPTVRVDWDALPPELCADTSLVDDLVAVVRESLSNVAQHAKASKVKIRISVEGDQLEVSVTDNGVGPPQEFSRHSGTSNLANRALRRAGSFSLQPAKPDKPRPGSVMLWTVRWRMARPQEDSGV
ncbi:MAG: GAF domain-containing protein [Demequinaceae bacterium]|nr:GAF domain-containing protein [Demequinaceae bacterium]